MQLAEKKLLGKCIRGATQTRNRNESWNGMLWGICSKTKFAGYDVVKLCAALTCLRFNQGRVYSAVLEAMGIPCGIYTSRGLAAQDNQCVTEVNRKTTERLQNLERGEGE